MIDEFRKSINSILYQRVNSPFWGALVLSWVIWNWEIIYLTLFVSSEEIEGTKIDYIKLYLAENQNNLIWWPLITLIVVLALLPFISNGAYWLSLKFKNWKVDQKRILEKKIPLSIEESIKLRSEIIKQEEAFETITKEKNKKIIEQASQIKQLESDMIGLEKSISDLNEETTNQKNTIQKLKEREDFSKIFKKVSVFEIVNREKWKFQIVNKTEIDLWKKNERKRFDLYSIKNIGSENFTILMYPINSLNKDHLEIRLLRLNRTQEIHEFEGEEIKIDIRGNAIEGCELNNIKIHDLL